MSVILESKIGDELFNLQSFHASPEGQPFSWATSRKFRVGERVRYVSFFQDQHYKNHPGLGWMVVVTASDGKRYAATHTQFVTKECWQGLKELFARYARRKLKAPIASKLKTLKLEKPLAQGSTNRSRRKSST
ncbi:MAG: hypothetical protein K2R98_13690 [Gemmataceae bacterium]|nr:hypothetical protein [Gemmataceae bacterium]